MRPLRAGKLPAEQLARLLATLNSDADPSIVAGPAPGEDAAVVDPFSELVVAKMDPITFATERIGWYAVQVNANDIAATGGTPRWFMATLFIPEGSEPSLADDVFGQLRDACGALGVSLIGGHTEVTVDLSRPILSGAMLGTLKRGDEVRTGGAELGDRLILTSGIAVEGTAILASTAREELLDAGFSDEFIDRARGYLDDPGISVVHAARAAREAGGIHAMHDPTEGGLATGIAELCDAAGLGVRIDAAAVNVYPESKAICSALGLDVWGLIASGALLVAAVPDNAEAVVASIRDAGIDANIIGDMVSPGEGRILVYEAREVILPAYERDEMARYLGA